LEERAFNFLTKRAGIGSKREFQLGWPLSNLIGNKVKIKRKKVFNPRDTGRPTLGRLFREPLFNFLNSNSRVPTKINFGGKVLWGSIPSFWDKQHFGNSGNQSLITLVGLPANQGVRKGFSFREHKGITQGYGSQFSHFKREHISKPFFSRTHFWPLVSPTKGHTKPSFGQVGHFGGLVCTPQQRGFGYTPKGGGPTYYFRSGARTNIIYPTGCYSTSGEKGGAAFSRHKKPNIWATHGEVSISTGGVRSNKCSPPPKEFPPGLTERPNCSL